MKWFLGTYTGRFNRKHKLFGHLFSGRYKALVVDGSQTGYLATVCDYVHLNPARAKLLRREQKLGAYPWSSYREYLKRPGRRPKWLRVDRVFGEKGLFKDSAAGRKEFERRMELRRWEDEPEEWKRLRRGWYLGDKEFRKELIDAMGQRVGAEHYGEERQETAEENAEAILNAELRKLKWTNQSLQTRLKGDPNKIKIAVRLRRETTMTVEWIAQRLWMGTRTYVNHLLYWRERKKRRKV